MAAKKKTAKPAKKPAAKAVAKKTASKPAAKKPAAKKAAPKVAAKKTTAKKAPAKAVKKTVTKKPAVKVAAKKPAAKPAAKTVQKPVVKASAPGARKPVAAKPAPARAASPSPQQRKPTSVKKSVVSPQATPTAAKRIAIARRQDVGDIKPYLRSTGESYMNDAQKAHFRGILLKWKSELMEEVDRTVSHMKDEAANFPDPADRATQEEEFSFELRTRDRERKLIKKIESTLDLIDKDDYGYCEACGVEIGIERLEARPTATLCIDCKTLAEHKEKRELG